MLPLVSWLSGEGLAAGVRLWDMSERLWDMSGRVWDRSERQRDRRGRL